MTNARQARLAAAAIAVVAGVVAGAAHAQPQPISSRDFNLELFQNPTLGESHLVAMARSIAPVAEGKMGLYANPASVALRPDHHAEPFTWTASATGQAASGDVSDYGLSLVTLDRPLHAVGSLLFWIGRWGLAANAGVSSTNLTPPPGSTVGGLHVITMLPGLAAARTFAAGQLAVGLGVRAVFFQAQTNDQHQGLFWNVNLPVAGGVIWRPNDANFRLGASGSVPLYRSAPQFDCAPMDCHGYVVPAGAHVPWTTMVGGAYRFGPSRWNIPPPGRYRDEHNLTVAVSLDVTGPVSNGNGVEAYAANVLQPTRAQTTLTPRLGVDAEVLPGWIRVRGGTYYEASRYPDIASRAHGTAGLELRLFEFQAWGYRRASLSAAGDWASRYSTFALSLGFWD